MTSAQCGEFICARDRTLFTRLIPCTPNVVGTAAHFLGHIEEQLTITGLIVSIVIPVTQTSSHIHAVVSSVDLHVIRRTDAGVVPNSIVTCARPTNARCLTLIHIITHSSLFIQVVP